MPLSSALDEPLSSALDEPPLVKREGYSPLPPSASLSRRFSGAQRLLLQRLIALTSKSIIAALARIIDAPEKIADVLKSHRRANQRQTHRTVRRNG